ncbi:MAG: thioredoxin family protein [Desulfobacula sp.]|nr:thioredoxin family protein [Desulfobacula sp.]
MKLKSWPFKAIAFVLFSGLLSSCMTPGKQTGLPAENKGSASGSSASDREAGQAEKEKIQKRIAEAVEEAKRTGKTSVDIYLDEDPGIVQTGDLVSVRYRAVLEDGTLISGTGPSAVKGSAGLSFQTLVAGSRTQSPGLGSAVLGLSRNGKKTVILSPEKAFGLHKDEAAQTFPTVRTMPLRLEINAQAYLKKFKALPQKGDRVRLNPYFESEVTEVTGEKILILNLARHGFSEQAPFGKTTLTVEGDVITMRLVPEIGASFPVENREGRIISADGAGFVVDFNHPFAGKALEYDLEIISLTKASAFKNLEIPWIDDHDKGLETARLQKKPAVLILYADWCQWCEKLFSQTFKDPRIKLLKDRLVFVKANSDLDQGLKSFYRQEGFPMMVFMDAKGNMVKKLEGFKDADGFLAEMEQIKDLERAEAGR